MPPQSPSSGRVADGVAPLGVVAVIGAHLARLAVVGVALRLLIPGATAAPVPDRALSPAELDAVGIDAGRAIRLDGLASDVPGPFRLELDVAGRAVAATLVPASIRAASFEVIAVRDGVPRSVPAPAPRTYRGESPGGATVLLSGVGDGWFGRITLPDGVTHWIDPLHDGWHALYSGRDVRPREGRCAVDGTGPDRRERIADLVGEPEPGCGRLTQLAFEADYPYFVLNGSDVDDTVADIEAILSVVEDIYRADVGIVYEITTVVVREDAESDPYSTSDAFVLWEQFASQWRTELEDIPRDLAHLMTGRNLSGSIIGIAELGVVCDPTFGYGISQSRYGGTFVQRVGLTAHEIGHNWNCEHCNGDADCKIMCTNIAGVGCTGILSMFGSRSQGSIDGHRQSRACLADGTPRAPVPRTDVVGTLAGEVALLDVLANDVSVTCRPLGVTGVTATTPAGGMVEVSGGTGPDGRDEIRYTPPAGFVGEDEIAYVVTDDTPLETAASSRVQVLDHRDAEPEIAVDPGLVVHHYTYASHGVPSFAELTPLGTEHLVTVEIRATFRDVLGSGKMDRLGGVFTGRLAIETAGAYTFALTSNDGARAYVGGRLVVDNDGRHAEETDTGVIELAAGEHPVRVEWYEDIDYAALALGITGPGVDAPVVPDAMWVDGVDVTWFDLAGLSWLPYFADLVPFGDGVADLPQVASSGTVLDTGLSDEVALRFEGFLEVPVDGVYTFHVTADEAAKLRIGDALTVDNDGAHLVQARRGFAALRAGRHPVAIEYYDLVGPAVLTVEVEADGLERQVVPAGWWSHDASLTPIDPDAPDVTVIPGTVPSVLRARAPRPNPFTVGTRLGFDVPRASAVTVTIHDPAGREVRRLLDTSLVPGRYDVAWDGRDDRGVRLGSGVYFVRVMAGGDHDARRIVRAR